MAPMHVRVTDAKGLPRIVNMALVVAVDPREGGRCALMRVSDGRLRDWLVVAGAVEDFAHLPGFVQMRFGSPMGWGGVVDGLVNLAHVKEFAGYGEDTGKSSVVLVDPGAGKDGEGIPMVCRGSLDEIMARIGG